MNTSHKVYLGIGSNLNKQHNITSCLETLQSSFKQCRHSPVYQSPAHGFDGHDFYNCCVEITTSFEPLPLKRWLMGVEDAHGRDRSQPRFTNRTLDIDLLIFDERIVTQDKMTIPRPEILTQAYVLKPLVDLAKYLIHPVTGCSLNSHWLDLQKTHNKPLTVVHI